jgi:serine/threonine protein kinase
LASSHERKRAEPGGEEDAFDDLLKQVAQVEHVSRSHTQPLLRPGSQLCNGRFEIVRRLGEGGMGVVYEAFDRARQHKVALKTLFRVDAAGIYRLKQEFRALSGVAHPNLVALYELFAEAELWFFTMELVDGRELVAALRDGAAPGDGALRDAFAQLVHGVQAIHAAGKLHRDLKPSNVLLTADGRVVILDFGLVIDPELGSCSAHCCACAGCTTRCGRSARSTASRCSASTCTGRVRARSASSISCAARCTPRAFCVSRCAPVNRAGSRTACCTRPASSAASAIARARAR